MKHNISMTLKKNKEKFKYLFTHRPLYCYDFKAIEACHLYNKDFFDDILEIDGMKNFDIHFSGHVHMY